MIKYVEGTQKLTKGNIQMEKKRKNSLFLTKGPPPHEVWYNSVILHNLFIEPITYP